MSRIKFVLRVGTAASSAADYLDRTTALIDRGADWLVARIDNLIRRIDKAADTFVVNSAYSIVEKQAVTVSKAASVVMNFDDASNAINLQHARDVDAAFQRYQEALATANARRIEAHAINEQARNKACAQLDKAEQEYEKLVEEIRDTLGVVVAE